MTHYVVKSSGIREPFSAEKFRRSLKRAGAPSDVQEKILREVLGRPDLDTTYKLYEYAYSRLKEETSPIAARYSLKSALYELGPEGFLFERFIGELFKAMGYEILLDQTIPGSCVDHEVDIVVIKDHEQSMMECKFHNRRGLKTDVKVGLYVKARFLDLSSYAVENGLSCKEMWLITNTQFTSQAIQYGLCSGLNLLGWAYPENNSISDLIDTYGLHPITSLTSLTKHQKERLLTRGILLCKELLKQPVVLKEFGLSSLEQQATLEECSQLSTISTSLP